MIRIFLSSFENLEEIFSTLYRIKFYEIILEFSNIIRMTFEHFIILYIETEKDYIDNKNKYPGQLRDKLVKLLIQIVSIFFFILASILLLLQISSMVWLFYQFYGKNLEFKKNNNITLKYGFPNLYVLYLFAFLVILISIKIWEPSYFRMSMKNLILKINQLIKLKKSSSIIIGLNEQSNNKYEVPISDFMKGGIIVGAIGTGKTTLRINILSQMINNNVSILDIDIKGDAPRLKSLNSKGTILIPGKNLYIDLFDKPKNMPSIEFIGVLNRSFIESLTDDDLSAPQKEILYSAIEKTVMKQGDLSSFFRNLIVSGVEYKDIIDNKQEQSVIALINKFGWLKNDLGSIFLTSSGGITGKQLVEENIFLDLSEIANSIPSSYMRFLIDIIMTKMMIYYKYIESYNFHSQKSNHLKVIFIDEAHLVVPKSVTKELTKIEEVITTLRYKGVSVIATTTNQSIISSTLKDTGFFIQFRNQLNYSNVQPDYKNGNTKLLDYEFYIMSKGTKYEKLKIKTIPIQTLILNPIEYFKSIQQPKIRKSTPFILNKTHFKIAQLEALVFGDLFTDNLRNNFRVIIIRDLYPIFQKLEINNIYQDFQKVIWEASEIYLSNNSLSSDLKSSIDLKGFLYEVLLELYYHLFQKQDVQLLPKKIENELKYKLKASFLNLIIFIDEYIKTLDFPTQPNLELITS